MKKLFGIVLASTLIAFGATAGEREELTGRDEGCSLRTFYGTYIWGSLGVTEANKPLAAIRMVYFDGKGNQVGQTVNSDGTEENLKGQYVVTKNCRAEGLYDNKRKVTYFLAPGGDRAVAVGIGGVVRASHLARVSKSNLLSIK